MARSLYRPTIRNTVEDYEKDNHFYHEASQLHYRMTEREGRFYQQRYQLDERGRQINSMEVEVSYIIGSGNHARSYLHLTDSGELTQLPITWYTQERKWGMSPGYDNPRHADFGRRIDHTCMFCHDAYPALPAGADRYGNEPRFPQHLASGIDCQRCHGPGSRHIELASSSGNKSEAIRGAIVNPRRLTPERQMDVCQQCHLEITSAPLPQAVARFGRPVYSFRPGQRLSDYLLHFDRPPKAGANDQFEIVGAAYRLRQSKCFLKSSGRMTCLTCHNPHRTPAGADAVAQFRAACRSCHDTLSATEHRNPGAADCASCHMPKRRTEDVVHVVMTDHLIQRRTTGRDPLAPLPEKETPYRGDLASYDAPQLSPMESRLYMGIALTKDGADRRKGIALLEEGVGASAQTSPEALIELADAHAAERNSRAAVEYYRKALALDPALVRVRYSLGRQLTETGDLQAAREQFEQVIREDPNLPEAHNNLGTVLIQRGEPARAEEEYRSAIHARSVYADPHNNLARLYLDQSRLEEAQAEAELALRCQPLFAAAWNTLGLVRAKQNKMAAAAAAFERAVSLDAGSTEAHYNLGLAIHAQGNTQAAIPEYRRAIQLDPRLAPAHLSLGVALGEGGKIEAAREEFREALRLRPGYPDALHNLNLLDQLKPGR
jgi:predicted CXXCH cytochrome family protein